ncbi:TatD family hydrolase [Candidatus Woesearchaeota archaeon]|nr:TatD family hydrolase [Candidatus Woesearchaeota archaeon]
MLLVDIHAHLDHDRFKPDLDKVIERAKKAGVKHIITSGVNSATNRLILEIAGKYDIVHPSFGLYPIDALAKEIKSGEAPGFARDIKPTNADKELEYIKKNKDKCVAVGEVGLDYKFGKGNEKEQKKIFQKVIDTVEKIKKPIIVHSRKAEFDIIDMLESSKIKNIILHCFCGRKHLVKKAADNGWNFSIPPIITRLQQFQIMAEIVNISQLLTETDCPYLSPYPGQRNEPAFVIETIKKIAEIKKLTQQETANSVFMNYQRIFN